MAYWQLEQKFLHLPGFAVTQVQGHPSTVGFCIIPMDWKLIFTITDNMPSSDEHKVKVETDGSPCVPYTYF